MDRLPEFRELVARCRIEHAERMVGTIASRAERAIARLVEFSENAENERVGLAATKAILEKWVALSVYFVQTQQYESLDLRTKALQADQAARKRPPGIRR